ncbi:MAG: hypothetical protein Q9178_008024 [Gyalolechia marmorata]
MADPHIRAPPFQQRGNTRQEPILYDDERLEIGYNQNAERQGGHTQNNRREHVDIQDAEREAGSGSIVHKSNGSTSEEQDREQGGERSPLNTPPASVAGPQAT